MRITGYFKLVKKYVCVPSSSTAKECCLSSEYYGKLWKQAALVVLLFSFENQQPHKITNHDNDEGIEGSKRYLLLVLLCVNFAPILFGAK